MPIKKQSHPPLCRLLFFRPSTVCGRGVDLQDLLHLDAEGRSKAQKTAGRRHTAALPRAHVLFRHADKLRELLLAQPLLYAHFAQISHDPPP